MIVLIERRQIEFRIRGSHGPPNAEEQARMMLKACCDGTSRIVRQTGDNGPSHNGMATESQRMAEVTITKYGPHG